jgi:hypothetical protein
MQNEYTHRIVISDVVLFEERNRNVISPRRRIARPAEKHCNRFTHQNKQTADVRASYEPTKYTAVVILKNSIVDSTTATVNNCLRLRPSL